MVQQRQQLRFTLEARQAFWISDEQIEECLERDIAIQFGIATSIDFAHAPRAYASDYFVDSEAGTGHEGHLKQRLYLRPTGFRLDKANG